MKFQIPAWDWIKSHRVVLTLAGFFLWLLIFDSDNLISLIQKRSELSRLNEEKEYYLKKTEEARKEQEELFTNMDALEKFAREHYLMKKDNEDIFIIEEED